MVLVNDCMKFDKEFSLFLEDAADLTPYVSESRYPDDRFVIPDVSTAKVDTAKADKILQFVKQKTAY